MEIPLDPNKQIGHAVGLVIIRSHLFISFATDAVVQGLSRQTPS